MNKFQKILGTLRQTRKHWILELNQQEKVLITVRATKLPLSYPVELGNFEKILEKIPEIYTTVKFFQAVRFDI